MRNNLSPKDSPRDSDKSNDSKTRNLKENLGKENKQKLKLSLPLISKDLKNKTSKTFFTSKSRNIHITGPKLKPANNTSKFLIQKIKIKNKTDSAIKEGGTPKQNQLSSPADKKIKSKRKTEQTDTEETKPKSFFFDSQKRHSNIKLQKTPNNTSVTVTFVKDKPEENILVSRMKQRKKLIAEPKNNENNESSIESKNRPIFSFDDDEQNFGEYYNILSEMKKRKKMLSKKKKAKKLEIKIKPMSNKEKILNSVYHFPPKFQKQVLTIRAMKDKMSLMAYHTNLLRSVVKKFSQESQIKLTNSFFKLRNNCRTHTSYCKLKPLRELEEREEFVINNIMLAEERFENLVAKGYEEDKETKAKFAKLTTSFPKYKFKKMFT